MQFTCMICLLVCAPASRNDQLHRDAPAPSQRQNCTQLQGNTNCTRPSTTVRLIGSLKQSRRPPQHTGRNSQRRCRCTNRPCLAENLDVTREPGATRERSCNRHVLRRLEHELHSEEVPRAVSCERQRTARKHPQRAARSARSCTQENSTTTLPMTCETGKPTVS